METLMFGAIRPPSASCDERGKCLQRELDPEPQPEPESDSESESESEAESEVKVEPYWWESIPIEDLKESDFVSRYEDDPYPFFFTCPQFVYENKAMRKQEEARNNAVDEYLKDAENITPFDAIPIPPAANVCGNNFPRPLPITEDRLPLFIELSKLALEKYNVDNQGTKYEFVELVKATRRPIPFGNYYITFKAKQKTEDATHVHPANCPAIIFQAHVWNRNPSEGPPVVESCSMKPT